MAIRIYPEETSTVVEHDFGGPSTSRKMSVEELAASIINDAIRDRFPLVLEMEKEIAQLEKRMIEKGKNVQA